MKTIFKIPIKWLIEQLKPKEKQEQEELGIGAVSEFNPVIKELVEKNKKEAFNLINK